MVEEKNAFQNDDGAESATADKKWSRLMIVAAVFLLGVFLPPEYKPYSPLLILALPLVAFLKKVRQAGAVGMDSAQNRSYSHIESETGRSLEPFSYTPKDPKDPRRYKPIG